MTHLYESLANLLEYPGEGWGAHLELCNQRITAESAELAPAFAEFYRRVESESLAALQERYTHTFDLNPVCTLEVGYHLFGENYKRGLFLANLQETEAPFDLGQQHQLPDYLPVLLRLLVKLDDAELRSALVAECMMPAVDKMLEALRQSDNLYSHLIEAINRALKAEAPCVSGFTGGCIESLTERNGRQISTASGSERGPCNGPTARPRSLPLAVLNAPQRRSDHYD